MKLLRWRKRKKEQDAAVWHIGTMLKDGAMSVDHLLAPGLWEDFPGNEQDVERFLQQVADDPQTSAEDRSKIERHLELLRSSN